jgi:hypothetical protein
MQMQTDETQAADLAIAHFNLARVTHREAVDRLAELQQQRAARKMEALVTLVGTMNPATQKNFTVSQAEDVLQLVPEYATYKARVAVAESEAREAEDEKEAARLTALARANAIGVGLV